MKKTILLLLVASTLSGCGAVGRLKQVGKTPKMSPVEEVSMPDLERSLGQAGGTQRRQSAGYVDGATPAAPAAPTSSASLFRPGAGAFLGDQRASRMGDIMTIRINVADRAEVGNTTSRTRSGSENASVTSLLGLEKFLPGSGSLANANSGSESKGGGNISRSETINMTMSAIVTGVMPNGNLLIRGRQEMRVNYELRELIVTGIVRPQDIRRDNSIPHTQIAEARISYGGRGQLSEVQQARWGQQIYDALFPF